MKPQGPQLRAVKSVPEKPVENPVFPIAGIGASAGGLEAFSEFLAALPEDSGMAFVLIQHLSADQQSHLSGLLSKSTRLPVSDAEQGMVVQPNHVYVITPNTSLSIANGILQVNPRDETGPHLPIDHFLKALAEDRTTGAIGVILSGAGTDGTQGLEEIKAVGGITFAQTESSAKFSSMPQSAIRSGCVDFIFSPLEIAQELSRISRHPYMGAPQDKEYVSTEENHYKEILAMLQASCGVNFLSYRDTTIKRRIMRRVVLHTKENLGDYAQILKENPEEVKALYNDILINVTSFFRDPETFAALKKTVFPKLLETNDLSTPIRIWVPGCSTGEEAYTIAMCLLEFLEEKKKNISVQIFATDLSDRALKKAREGLYLDSIEADVSAERLQRFFTLENGKYRICKSIREMCAFARQNVTADPPFSKMDLISCRNLLIYMALPLQRRVIPTFHYALNPGGYLLLGSSETVGKFTDLFETVDEKNRIYLKKTASLRQYPHFTNSDHQVYKPLHQEAKSPAPALNSADWQRQADRVIMGQYAPAGVLINDGLDILQFRSRTSPYLEPPSGDPSHNLMRMACEGLFPMLRIAVDECRKTAAPVVRHNVRVRRNEQVREISVRILPVKVTDQSDHCFLVLFEENQSSVSLASKPSKETNAQKNDDVSRLQQELADAHDYLQSVIEQKDAVNEDLKAAHEEGLSSNEELQSTNEELETAKEELQSVNEELTTVNEQIQHRNHELNRLTDDLSNLLGSAGIPMIVIGNDMQIRHSTPVANKLFRPASSIANLTIANLKAALKAPDLDLLLQEAIETAELREREVQDKEGHWWLLRTHPYRTADGEIDGAVIVLLDVDEIRKSRERLQEEREYGLAIIETVRGSLLVLNADLRVQFANQAFYEEFEVTKEDIENSLFYDLGNKQWDLPDLRHMLEEVLPEKSSLHDFEVAYNFKGSEPKVMLLNARRILAQGKATQLILLSIEDITLRKTMEGDLKNYAADLYEDVRRKDEFLAMLAHELRNPLAPVYNALQVLKSSHPSPKMTSQAHDVMDRQLKQMVRLIDDLLDVSRITQGKIDLHVQTIDLTEVVQNAVETSQPLITAAGHTLTVTLPEKPLWLKADAARMTQVLGNLLNNAAKYTKDGGQIWLRVRREDNEAVITVKDNGVGIPPDMLGYVFGMFSQLDNSLERAQGGLGIGLMLVKNLVELHGGTVTAFSAGLGQGAEFTVRLPHIAKPREQKVTDSQSDAKMEKNPSPCRVLIVDDNKVSAQTMGWMVEMLGHEVQIAHDGPGALAMAKDFRPAMVLLDIGMPGMSGFEICKKMRKDTELKKATIVAQTGWGQDEYRKQSKEAGFDQHLVKPIALDVLKKLLATCKSPGAEK